MAYDGITFQSIFVFSVQFPSFFSLSFFTQYTTFLSPTFTEAQRLKETTVKCRSEILTANRTKFSNPKDYTRLKWRKRKGNYRSDLHWMRSGRNRHLPSRRELEDWRGREDIHQPSFLEWRLTDSLIADNLTSNSP